MRKVLCFLAGVAVCLGAVPALGGTYTFQPSPADLYDLNHYRYYAWGIDWSVPDGECISGAQVSIDNINDWTNESGDILHIRLVDSLPSVFYFAGSWPGVKIGYDGQGAADAFAGYGVPIGTYTDPGPGQEDISFTFDAAQLSALDAYIANDGIFGLTFDPDCHYYNDGISLAIYTKDCPPAIPEPMTALALTAGLGGLGAYLRRRRLAAGR